MGSAAAGDLLVVDEAGMLDQDTARALLTVADDCQVRVALLADYDADAARQRADVVGALVDAAADRVHAKLLGRWDADRDVAAQAARTVGHGPCRLGLRRAAAARAGGQGRPWGSPRTGSTSSAASSASTAS